MRPLGVLLSLVLWAVQGAIMLLLVVPLQRTAQLLTWVSWKVIRHPYYFVSQTRRRLDGRPLWQDSDLQLGITPPKSEWDRLGIIDVDTLREIP